MSSLAKCAYALALSTLLLAACTIDNPDYCEGDHECAGPTPFCDIEGKYLAAEGINNTCIPTPAELRDDLVKHPKRDRGPDGPAADAALVELDGSPEPECTNGTFRDCYDGPEGTEGVGICVAGTQTCFDEAWGPCEDDQQPEEEDVCGDSLDQDCDGEPRACTCTLDEQRDCYEGAPIDWADPPVSFGGASVCKAGTQTCIMGEGGELHWNACEGDQGPEAEEACKKDELGNGIDENCDGQVDETCKSCLPQPYYRDADGDGVGVAADVEQACTAPTGYAPIAGDCDDAVPAVLPGKKLPCGQCGTKTCKTDKSGTWTACAGDTTRSQDCQTCGTQSCQADGTWGGCVEAKRDYYLDGDGDQWGAGAAVKRCASEAAGYSVKAGDCNDGDPKNHSRSVRSVRRLRTTDLQYRWEWQLERLRRRCRNSPRLRHMR